MVSFSVLESYQGPNPYASEAGFLAALSIEDADLGRSRMRCDEMAKAFAPWFDAAPFNRDEKGDPLETRLGLASFLASLTLAALNEVRGKIRTAYAFEQDGALYAFIGSHRHRVSLSALANSVELFNDLARRGVEQIKTSFSDVWSQCTSFHPDYQARMLMQGADKKAIPYLPLLDGQKFWQYGWGKRGRLFFESGSFEDSLFGGRIANDKQFAKLVFEALGAPVVPHVLVNREQDLEGAVAHIGWPCIVKPVDRGRSVGVTVGITDMPSLRKAFAFARQHSAGPLMVERHISGDVHRIMIIRGEVAWAIRREAPFVIGDGRRTLAELVDAQNRAIIAAQRPDMFRGPIPRDEEFQAELQRQACRLEDIVPHGRKVTLRKVPLLSTGAVYTDVTHDAHPDVLQIAKTLAQGLGIKVCGLDYIAQDIGQSYLRQGAFIEINAVPGLRVPMMAGMAPEVIGALILGDEPGRIPITLILCPEELHAELWDLLDFSAADGWVIGRQCGLGSMPLVAPAAPVPPTAHPHELTRCVLRNPNAASLTIVSDPEQIMAHGLPVDHCDTIITCAHEPPVRWQSTYERHSMHYRSAQTPAEAAGLTG